MTIDEAIKWQEDCVKDFERLKKIRAITEWEIHCNQMHKQLAEWLTELKAYRQAFEDIRAEIQIKYDSIPWRNTQYDDGWIEGLEWVLEEVIDKHNPDKAESEG